MPASRSRASRSRNAIGSSLTLPLVITSGPPTASSSRWCSGVYGSSTPRSALARGDRLRHARAGAVAAPRRSAARRDSSAASTASERARAAAPPRPSRTISANGFSSRCLRARSARDRLLVVGAAGEVDSRRAP